MLLKFSLLNPEREKLIDPETFRDFYTCWKETEAEAQEVSLPALLMDHLDKNECVYKLSSSVKTNRGVGKIAMTQKRLFLLPEGRPGYVEIATFRNIEVRRSWCQMQPLPKPLFVLGTFSSMGHSSLNSQLMVMWHRGAGLWGAGGQYSSLGPTVVTMFGGTR